MRRLLSVGLAGLLLLSGGCGSPNDAAFKRPKKLYGTVVSLSPGTTEIISMEFGSERLVGRTASCNFPASVEKIPIVTKGPKPDYEKLAEMKPDLIVYDPVLYNDQDVQKLKELGIDLFALKAGSLNEFEKSLYVFGSLTKSETNMSDYVTKIEGARGHANASNETAKPKVAVIMPGKGSEHSIAGLSSFQADLVRAAGGTPVGPAADRIVALNVESLIRDDPDIVVVAGDKKDRESVSADPRFQALKAVKGKRVFSFDPDIILRAGSRVDVAITKLAEVIGS